MNATEYFLELIETIPDAKPGKMFGCLCAKMPNGKAGMMLKNDQLIVKISAEEAATNGFSVFTPMEGRPMNGWFEIPFSKSSVWQKFAEISCASAAKLEKKEKIKK